MEQSDQNISGIYLLYKKWELYWLENKKESKQFSIDYFKLDKVLHKKFPNDTCVKILEHVNCDRKVALDFDNVIAKVILEKDEPFENQILRYMDPKFIQQTIDDPESFEELYSKPNNNIRKL